ncbi:hypothetical protein [Alkalihalobacterium elongatum]|uniref:hypothetical protein n=1 Tax=Alkalihalobacterium elongatum TaxID=2675466 RepID=UPI001C1F5931|nr:hypothetical protein [Alkalihalobacterium elongatum]
MEWILIPISFFCAYYTIMYARSLFDDKEQRGFVVFLILLCIPLVVLPLWLYMRV